MNRIASLDFLRGVAAFSVAIPHYLTLNVAERPLAEAVAVTGVEVFFVLSGFVLAPQILTMVVGGPIRNLRIFIVRRWMRTIPPYLISLILIAIVTGQLLTWDFVRYALYIQNLFSQANTNDFFPVAWSLSVEEWFYVTFAPLLFLLGKLLNRKGVAFAATFGLCFILAIIIARYFGPQENWDAAVRRVTVFRVDSIAWGFLLYIATEHVAPFDMKASRGRTLYSAAVGFFLACGALAVATAYFSADSAFGRQAFPFVAAAFGISAVFVFRQSEFLFAGNASRKIGIFAGHISYSVYLFHLLLAMIIKPRLADLNVILQLAIFVGLLVILTTIVWLFVEKPILAARPKYDRDARPRVLAAQAPTPSATPSFATIAAAVLALACGYVCYRAYYGVHAKTFYVTFIAATGLAAFAASRTRIIGIAPAALTAFFFAALLPPADYLARKTETSAVSSAAVAAPLASASAIKVKPAYSFTAGKTDPDAFHAWWALYAGEWSKLGGGKDATERPDPKGLLPFVTIPNSSTRFFDSIIRINNLGFRGSDVERDKHNRFRIFALGESPTFGPTLHPGDRTWPEYLQDLMTTELTCDQPIEVINAGTEAYTLANNVERLQRDIVPLKPDIVVSYHGYNGLSVLFGGGRFSDAAQEPQRENRPSLLLREVSYRARLSIFNARSKKVAPVYTEDQIMHTDYADNYRKLLGIARENGFSVVLASSSMAVAPSSPSEVKAFYGAVFTRIDDTIVRNAAHNEMVRKIAAEHDAPFIDTTSYLDGVWDDDLFLDLVHFTQSGNKKMAKAVFDGLTAVLGRDQRLNCRPRR